MSTGRWSSTASLVDHGRTTSPDPTIRDLDFCNAFWGVGDVGVDVLFARMRSAAQTMDELRNFWKERSTIEEEYAKRLAKLAKMSIGKDEIGELRESLDTLRIETDRQAGFHSLLAQQIRTDVEAQVNTFVSKQLHKKKYQTATEKEFKIKQTREQHVSKAREKYESDCLRINSYAAQSMVVQGKDLEKLQLKLERAQQTVQVNESEYNQFTMILQETMQKWEQDWKAFCDTCQDLEEERMEFMKDNLWAYANAVSETCVSDDRACERLRIALDHFQPKTDLENFVRDYGTGNAIPELPAFVDYTNTGAPPLTSSTQAATRPANFVRSTQTVKRSVASLQDDEPSDDTNIAGVGAGVSGSPSRGTPIDATSLSRSATQKLTTGSRSLGDGVDGYVSPAQDPQIRQSDATAPTNPVPVGDPVDPTVSNTQLVIGDRAWDVDPNKDPQQQKTTQARTSSPVAEQDPLVKQMEELSMTVATSGSIRSTRDGVPSSNASHKSNDDSSTSLTTTGATGAPCDFRNSAEVVVGSCPLAQAPSRSASPNPPKAVLAAPPPPSVLPSTSDVPVGQVVIRYQRPFPGELQDQANSYVGSPPPVVNRNPDQGVSHSASRGVYPGVGTQTLVPRPPSPARGPSPMTTAQSYNVPPAPSSPPSNGALHRDIFVSPRLVTPTNPISIALGPDGRVVRDTIVQQLVRQAPAYVPPGPPPPPPPPPSIQPQTYSVYHDSSRAPTHPQRLQPPPLHDDYVVVASNVYDHPPQPPDYHDAYQTHPHGQLAQSDYNSYGSARRPAYLQRSQTVGHLVANATHQGYVGNTSLNRSMSLEMRRSPSPAPPHVHQPPQTWTHADNGRQILFYVKALYNYTATTDEEFDFQEGDIIAVTETPEDGWWSGELLDDQRKHPGRHVFPSNFVCLF